MLSCTNERRGDDSWGFFDPAESKIYKGLGGISGGVHEFIECESGFGHTRKGTTGEITIPNAHPFDIGNIIGAHNGMVFNHDELNTKYNREHAVDSMHIFSHLHEGKNLDEIRGYGSIQWVEKDSPNNIYLCRVTSEAELAIAAIEDDDSKTVGVVWSSDTNHLKAALKVSGVKFSEYKVEVGVVYLVQKGNLYKTDKTHSFSNRWTSEMNLDWRQGRLDVYTPSTDYQSWLSQRRGQTRHERKGILSDEDRNFWKQIRLAKTGEEKEESRSTKSVAVFEDTLVDIPDSIKESSIDWHRLIRHGGSEYSMKHEGWVSFDAKVGKFKVGTVGTGPTYL